MAPLTDEQTEGGESGRLEGDHLAAGGALAPVLVQRQSEGGADAEQGRHLCLHPHHLAEPIAQTGGCGLAQRAIDLFAALGDSSGLWRGYRYLGEAAMGAGDVAGAEPLFQRELAVAREGDDRRGQGDAYNMLGQAARCLGRYGEANALLEQGVALFRALQDAGAVSSILVNLGDVARDAGDARSARGWYREAWRSERNLANKRHIAYLLEGIAAAAALEGDGRLALVYLGAAGALREEIDWPQPPADQARLARILTPVLAVLSSEEQQEALVAGRSRPLPEVVAEALAPLPPTPSPSAAGLDRPSRVHERTVSRRRIVLNRVWLPFRCHITVCVEMQSRCRHRTLIPGPSPQRRGAACPAQWRGGQAARGRRGSFRRQHHKKNSPSPAGGRGGWGVRVRRGAAIPSPNCPFMNPRGGRGPSRRG